MQNWVMYPPVLYFNSIKVRLELFIFSILIHFKIIFQFHKGTIRTIKDFGVPVDSKISIP